MKSKLVFVVLFLSGFNLIAQQKLTVEEIYSGAFKTETMDELFAMKNSNQYTVLNFDRSTRSMQLDLYDFARINHDLISSNIGRSLLYQNGKFELLIDEEKMLFLEMDLLLTQRFFRYLPQPTKEFVNE